MSSRLLSMKSANALLELPATGDVISAGTLVSAIIISELRSTATSGNSTPSDSAFALSGTVSHTTTADRPSDAEVRVAVLTVSDTVAMGAGPDRRYWATFYVGAYLHRHRHGWKTASKRFYSLLRCSF